MLLAFVACALVFSVSGQETGWVERREMTYSVSSGTEYLNSSNQAQLRWSLTNEMDLGR